MISDTASSASSRQTIPISPCFSTDSSTSAPASEATSDEEPDLGAFTAVLRAWNHLQPYPRIPIGFPSSSSSSGTPPFDANSSISSFTHPGFSSATISATDEMNAEEPATAWEDQLLGDYLEPSVRSSRNDGHSPGSDGSERTVEISSDLDNQDTVSMDDSVRQDPSEMAVPVFSPNPEPSELVSASSQHTLRRPDFPDFPIHEMSTVGGSKQWSQTSSSPTNSSFPHYASPSRRTYLPIAYRGRPHDSEAAVRSLLQEATRNRSLVNDGSSTGYDRSSRPTAASPRSLLQEATRNRSVINDASSTGYDRSSRSTSDSSPSLQTQPQLQTPVSSVGDVVLARSPPIFVRQPEPPSPMPTPTEASETFPYEETEYDIRTPTRRPDGQGSYTPRHVYPRPLTGLHVLPTTLEGADIAPPASETSYDHTASTASEYGAASQHTQDGDEDGEHPTLGLLDEALSFIASERARFQATKIQHQHHFVPGTSPDTATTSNDLGNNVVETKPRKRRRKKSFVPGGGEMKSDDADGASEVTAPSNVSGAVQTRPLLLAVAPADKAGDLQSEVKVEDGGEEGLEMIQTPKKKATKKGKDPVPTITSPGVKPSGMTSLAPRGIIILSRPKAEPTSAVADISVTSNAQPIEGDASFSLMGKRGKRVGRREREREKARRDAERAAAGLDAELPTAGLGGEYGSDDDDDEANNKLFTSATVEGDFLQPQAKGTKSLPTTSRGERFNLESEKLDNLDAHDDEEHISEQGPVEGESGSKPAKAKKKTRSKRNKPIPHAKSYPSLHDAAIESDSKPPVSKKISFEYEDMDDMEDGRLSQYKRSRLVVLANKLLATFPEQKKDLKKVIKRLEVGDGAMTATTTTSGTDKALSIPATKKGRGHTRGNSGTIVPPTLHLFSNPDIAFEDDVQDPAELDIQGSVPTPGASLIHVFIDHSNILIGLLNFLKRHPPPQGIIDEYMSSYRRTTNLIRPVPSQTNITSSKPIAIPSKGTRSTMPIVESPVVGNDYPIPLPSFATGKPTSQKTLMALSKSLPNTSVLDAHMGRNGKKRIEGVVSDGDDDESKDTLGDTKKKFPRHLWHAALALVLERGRAVSRRVVVTSSPLYQPMDKIQQLGYEVRIYIRVPDLGDGMDRRDKEAKYNQGKSNMGNGKASTAGIASSPVKNTTLHGAAASTTHSFSPSSGAKGHVRHISGNTSADSGTGSNTKLHVGSPGHGNSMTNQAAAAVAKIRYREQGVDELLQLKLHQALADVDKVPKGSTIVLATGDGNVGQFSEDGFLGPVRTALKRGWKVELYAWEDGLSKAWRREFGENSEWGQKGLFRIIPLEQFATNLVEAAGW